MKRYVREGVGLLVTVGLLVSLGCGAPKVPDEIKRTSVIIRGDGTVTSHMVEILDKDYYDLQGLQNMASEEVRSFNVAHTDTKDSMTLERVEALAGSVESVVVTYRFGSVDAYCEYTGGGMFYGTLSQAERAGYSLKNMNRILYDPDKKESIHTDSLVIDKALSGRHVLIVEEQAKFYCPANFYCPYKVSYISEGAEMAEDGSVDTRGAAPENFPIIIILKK